MILRIRESQYGTSMSIKNSKIRSYLWNGKFIGRIYSLKEQTRSFLRSMMGILEPGNEDMDVHEKEPNKNFVVIVILISAIIIIKIIHTYIVHWFH